MNEPSPIPGAQELQHSVRCLLQELRGETASDFAAIALYDPENKEIRWRVAFGALSERYRGIAIRIGKGIAGGVLSTGRPMVVASFPADMPEHPLEYPIMIVEQLVSCYAAPIGDARRVFGVLMIGQRTARLYRQAEQEAARRAAERIGALYAPSYDAAEIPPAASCRGMPADRTPSALEAYIQQQNKGDRIRFELLDQRAAQISERFQEEMIAWFDRLAGQLAAEPGIRMHVSVERRNGQWISVEAFVNRRVDDPWEALAWLIKRIGELRGNVELYNEPDGFRLIVNLTIGLLFDDKPWTF